MNTGLLERKEGTEKVRQLINYTNYKGCRLIMEDFFFFLINSTYFRNDCNNIGHLLWLVDVWLEKLSENRFPWENSYCLRNQCQGCVVGSSH